LTPGQLSPHGGRKRKEFKIILKTITKTTLVGFEHAL
jgi:hypothetical protein